MRFGTCFARCCMNTTETQRQRDSAYVQAYEAWISTLTPDEHAALVARDLDKPDARRRTGKNDDHRTLAVVAAPGIDALPAAADVQAQIRMATADALASFCARVRSQANPLLAFDTLCFASGLMELEGLSQSSLARRHGVTKAWFSQQVIAWLDLFDLPPPRGCRSMRVRGACRRARIIALEAKKAAAAGMETPVQAERKRRRYPPQSENPTVVYVRGLDLFRAWFRRRTRRHPVDQWTPAARRLLRKELAWFKELHDSLAER